MKTTFTKEYVLENCGCYSKEQIEEIWTGNGEANIKEILGIDIPLKDKFWFVIKKCDLSVKEKVKIAVDLSEIVLPIFEEKHPKYQMHRKFIEFIEIANKWLTGSAAADAAIYASYAAADAYVYSDYDYEAVEAAAYTAAAYASDAAYTTTAYTNKLKKYLEKLVR